MRLPHPWVHKGGHHKGVWFGISIPGVENCVVISHIMDDGDGSTIRGWGIVSNDITARATFTSSLPVVIAAELCWRPRGVATSLLKTLEQTRRRYGFVVVGYVVMPEHVHLLISESEKGNPSVVMQVLKQRFAHAILRTKRAREKTPRMPLGWETGRTAYLATPVL
jgi:hypothetical protein